MKVASATANNHQNGKEMYYLFIQSYRWWDYILYKSQCWTSATMAVALLKSQVIKYLPSLNTCTQTNKQTYKFIKIFLKILKNIRNMYDMEEEKSEIFIQGSL